MSGAILLAILVANAPDDGSILIYGGGVGCARCNRVAPLLRGALLRLPAPCKLGSLIKS